MSDATEAIIDIIEALEQYGSTITIKSITKGGFNPFTGDYDNTIEEIPTKGLVRWYTSFELQNSDIHSDDLKFMIYSDSVIDYNHTLVFDSKEYVIKNIDKKILQDENLYYTIQGRANAT